MADVNKTLRFLLVGEDRSASRAIRGVSDELDQQNQKWSQWEKVAVGASAAVIAGLAVMGKKAVDAASDLNESANAVQVTFGESADGVMALGEAAAESLGLSQTAFNGIAVQFSAFAEQVAGEGGDVVGVLDDLTTRGADFASVMNMDVNEAMRVFQSGLAGETEPLRKYGIDLSAAAVGAYAVANGIAESAKSMSESEKVQARYALLMEQTAKVSGDFANTADSAANQQRILSAQWEDAQAKIGQKLLPVMQDLLSVGTATVGWLADNSDLVLVLSGAVGTLAAAVIAVEGAQRAWNATQAVTKAITGHNITGVGTFVTKLGAVGIALGIAGTLYMKWKAQQEEAARQVEELTDTLDAQTGAVTENTAAWVSSALSEERKIGGSMKSLKDAADDLGISLDLLTRAWLQQPEAVDEVNRILGDHVDTSREYISEAMTLGHELSLQGERMDEAAEAARDKAVIDEAAAGAQAELAGAYGETTEAIEEEIESVEDLIDAQRKAAGIVKDVMEAESDFQAAIDKASESVKANGKTLDLNTEKGRANQAALLDLADAGWENVEALMAQDPSGKTARRAMEDARTAFVDAAIAAGYGADEANRLADDLRLIPKNVNTLITANAQDAIRAAEEALRAIGAIPTYKLVTIDGSLTSRFEAAQRAAASTQFGTLYRAEGGYTPPGWTIVGEEGPELVNFTNPSRVYTAEDTREMLGGGRRDDVVSVRPVHITTQLVLDGRVLAESVRKFDRGLK